MKVAIIGAGNMGSAVACGIAGMPEVDLWVSNPSEGKLKRLTDEFDWISVTRNNVEAAEGASAVILAVKPWILPVVMTELHEVLCDGNAVVVSMAGGIGLDDVEGMLGAECKNAIFYVIPNTAAMAGESMTFMAHRRASEEQIADVVGLFESCGKVVVTEERMVNAGMVTASCGIAFAMRFMRAMEQGAVELGLRPDDARHAVIQTLKGAAVLLEKTDTHPEEAIDAVTTAGGLTIKGLNAMECGGMTGAVVAGMRAAMPKS